MELASQFFHSSKELKAIQRVRMSLGVISLSDICNTNGSCLDKSFYSTTPVHKRRNNYTWPLKHHVYKSDYTIWRKLLNFIFSNGSHSLYQPLGHWTILSYTEWTESWDYFVTPDRQFVYQQIGPSSWKRHLQKSHSHHSYYHEYLHTMDNPSTTLLRATVSLDNNSIRVISSSEYTPFNPPNQDTITFDAISITKPSIDWFFHHLSSSPTTTQLLHHLLEGSAYAVSDGSFFPGSLVGAAA